MHSKRNAKLGKLDYTCTLRWEGKKRTMRVILFLFSFFSYRNVWYVWIWIFSLEKKNHCVLILVFWLTPDITLPVPIGFIHFEFFVFCKMLSVRHGLVWRAYDHRRVAGFKGHNDAQGGDFQATSFHLHQALQLPNQALFRGSRADVSLTLQVKLTLSLTFKHTYFLWKSRSLPNHHKRASYSSVAQSCPTLLPHGMQHARLPCPLPTPGAYSNSCPSSRWCHPTISSSVVPFSRLQYFSASGSFPRSQFFVSGDQSISKAI